VLTAALQAGWLADNRRALAPPSRACRSPPAGERPRARGRLHDELRALGYVEWTMTIISPM
jgi:hypothetical protein